MFMLICLALRVFPMYVGVNRHCSVTYGVRVVFPMYVGVNRKVSSMLRIRRIPHVCGGEPISVTVICFLRIPHVCGGEPLISNLI